MRYLLSLGLLCLVTVLAHEAELEWWQKTVIYQIYPRSFKDTDGDGYGDLQGVISKLDYIQTLGVGTVWLSPIYPSPGADAGYDISNYEDVDPLFGDLETFDRLLEEVHNRGMYLMLDFVPNHSSDEHPWFVESKKAEKNPYTDYYVWVDGKQDPNDTSKMIPPNNWLSGFGGSAWTWVEERKQFYFHQYLAKQPDLNYRNPDVAEEMKNVLRFWLNRGVDGFRMDTIATLFEDALLRDEILINPNDPNVNISDRGSYQLVYTENQPETFDMIQQFRSVLDEYRIIRPQQPVRVMVAESSNTMKWYGTYDRESTHFPFNFILISKVNKDTKGSQFVPIISQYLVDVPVERWSNWVVGNHDTRRVGTRLGLKKIDIINAMNLLLPGTTITYMGEELGMEDNTDITYEQGQDPQGCNAGPDGYANKTRDYPRSPFQWDNTTNAGFTTGDSTWLPVHKNYLELNVMLQESEADSHLKLYRQLTRLARLPSVQRGTTYVNSQGEDVLLIVREREASNSVTVIINWGMSEQNVNATAVFGNRFDNYYLVARSVGSSLSVGSKLDPESLLMPPETVAVFETNTN